MIRSATLVQICGCLVCVSHKFVMKLYLVLFASVAGLSQAQLKVKASAPAKVSMKYTCDNFVSFPLCAPAEQTAAGWTSVREFSAENWPSSKYVIGVNCLFVVVNLSRSPANLGLNPSMGDMTSECAR